MAERDALIHNLKLHTTDPDYRPFPVHVKAYGDSFSILGDLHDDFSPLPIACSLDWICLSPMLPTTEPEVCTLDLTNFAIGDQAYTFASVFVCQKPFMLQHQQTSPKRVRE